MGDLSEDSRSAYSSYTSPLAFELQKLEAKSIGTAAKKSHHPTDIMYTVVLLACAKAVALRQAKCHLPDISWQDLSKKRKRVQPDSRGFVRNPAIAVGHGVEAVQKVLMEDSMGLKANAASNACHLPCGRKRAGRSLLMIHLMSGVYQNFVNALLSLLVTLHAAYLLPQRLFTVQEIVSSFQGCLTGTWHLAGFNYAVSSALIKTAAQEHRRKTWLSLSVDANAATVQDCNSTDVDEYGSSIASGIVYRPQLQPLRHDYEAHRRSERVKGILSCHLACE